MNETGAASAKSAEWRVHRLVPPSAGHTVPALVFLAFPSRR